MHLFIRFSLAVLLPSLLMPRTLTAGSDVRTVVFFGQPAPGTPGYTLRPLDAFRLNDLGEVAFVAEAENGSLPAGTGIWLDSAGQLSLVARAGDPAPGTATTFNDLRGGVWLNNVGRVAFGANGIGAGIWSDAGGSLQNEI
jgi:hypothetical protein